MRVLQVCSAATLGGGEVHIIELVESLRASGHDVAVAGRRDGPLQSDLQLPFLNAADVYTSYRLRRFVSERGFDIVHAHVARDYPIAALALLARRRPKLVLTRQLIRRVKANPLYARVDGWIVTTDQIRRSVAHLKPHSSVVIPNWVDTRRFPYRERPVRRPAVVGLLGQISPHKGHDDAIKAMRELNDGYQLLVGGEGESEYVDALRNRARGLPIEFLGFVKPERFLEQIDILILPSWEEPFGIVVLEAMSAGVSVIATDAGGPPEILAEGQAGLLVPPRDPRALAGAIRRLASDDSLRNELRVAARRRALERYEISLTVPQIENYYRELIH